MLKYFGRACVLAAMSVSMVAGSGVANAATLLDIVDFIDSSGAGDTDNAGFGEKAVTAAVGTLQISGVNVIAYGGLVNPGTNYSTPYAYLDGGNAGMGVCSSGISASFQCSTPSDDNVTQKANGDNEILSIAFTDKWTVDQLLFRYEGHTPEFYADGSNTTIAAGSEKIIDIAIVNGAYTSYTIENVGDAGLLGAALIGWSSLIDLASNTFIHMKFNNEQFYLSGVLLSQSPGQITPIPLPAGIIFLLSGLLGLGMLGRLRRKNA